MNVLGWGGGPMAGLLGELGLCGEGRGEWGGVVLHVAGCLRVPPHHTHAYCTQVFAGVRCVWPCEGGGVVVLHEVRAKGKRRLPRQTRHGEVECDVMQRVACIICEHAGRTPVRVIS